MLAIGSHLCLQPTDQRRSTVVVIASNLVFPARLAKTSNPSQIMYIRGIESIHMSQRFNISLPLCPSCPEVTDLKETYEADGLAPKDT